jgi:hypothetical protein
VVQNIAAMDTYGAKFCPFGDVVQNIASLHICGAKYCPFAYTWCKILHLWVHVVQNIAHLDRRGAKYCPRETGCAK